MSQPTINIRNGLFALSLAGALLTLGCEQRPAETDPPPTTPDEQSPDTAPERQPLGERTGQARARSADPRGHGIRGSHLAAAKNC
jgi:hypothetical protein